MLLCAALFKDHTKVYTGLSFILAPSWEKLLTIPLWTRAAEDTVRSLGLGYGILTFLTALSTTKVKCFR